MAGLQVRLIGGFLHAMAQMTQSHGKVYIFRSRKFKVNIKILKNLPKVEN